MTCKKNTYIWIQPRKSGEGATYRRRREESDNTVPDLTVHLVEVAGAPVKGPVDDGSLPYDDVMKS